MKTLAIALLACLSLMAQTTTPPPTAAMLDQLQNRVKSSAPMILMMIGNKPTSVQLDPTLFLNLATNPPTLSAPAAKPAPPPIPQIDTFQITVAAATVTLTFTPNPNTLACYRNGMRLTSGFDFTQSAAVLTFATGALSNAPQVGDLFTCDYQH